MNGKGEMEDASFNSHEYFVKCLQFVADWTGEIAEARRRLKTLLAGARNTDCAIWNLCRPTYRFYSSTVPLASGSYSKHVYPTSSIMALDTKPNVPAPPTACACKQTCAWYAGDDCVIRRYRCHGNSTQSQQHQPCHYWPVIKLLCSL